MLARALSLKSFLKMDTEPTVPPRCPITFLKNKVDYQCWWRTCIVNIWRTLKTVEACKKMFIRVVKIKDCVCEGTFINCWWECKMAQPTGETVQGFKKLNIHPPLWSRHFRRKANTSVQRLAHQMVTALVAVPQNWNWKQPKCASTKNRAVLNELLLSAA